MRIVLLMLLQWSGLVLVAQNNSTGILLTDMLKIKQVSGVQASRNGDKVYCLVTAIEADPEKKWEYQYTTNIWSVPTDGVSAARQITTSKTSVSQMVISPDGRQLAFIRSVDNIPQLFLLDLSGGEAIQLTNLPYGVSAPRWSPDSRELVFVASIPWKALVNDSSLNPDRELPKWLPEKPGYTDYRYLENNRAQANPDGSLEEARAWLQLNEKDKKAKVINRLQFQEESTTTGELSLSQVFLVRAQAGAQPRRVTGSMNSFSNPQFLTAGTLLVQSEADQQVMPDRNVATALYTINTDGSNFRPWLKAADSSFSGAQVSPSGKWVAFLMGPARLVSVPQIGILPIDGNRAALRTVSYDRSKMNLAWKDEELLYALCQSNGGVVILQHDLHNRRTQVLGTTDAGISNLSIGSNQLYYVKTTVHNPFEVYSADKNGKNEKRLTGFNEDWLAGKTLVEPQKYSFPNEQGMEVEYWVMPPARREPGKKYPLLLQIHGGPAAMWGPGESSMWHEFQYWCSKGYGVVYSNPRGSGGYGESFLKANILDWGNGPMQDVLTVLGKAGTADWVDTSKLFVSGGSYAGYLVAYILGHDQRFTAACAQRGVYDLTTFFGEGNAWRLVPSYFGGYPWEDEAKLVLEKESPISYVRNIRTPLIIFHGENDLRTGVIGSEQLYKSLKVLGRPVEYVRHPGATHEITRSGNNRQRMDQLLRTWEYFERYR